MQMPTVQVQKTGYGLRLVIDPPVTDVALLASCLDSAAAQLRLMAESAAAQDGKRLEMKGEQDADQPSEDTSGRKKMGKSKSNRN